MLNKLHITEKLNDGWYLSFEKPEFQGGETIKIDEETAREIMSVRTKNGSISITDPAYEPNAIR